MRLKKKWSGWFVPLSRGKKNGPLIWTKVKIKEDKIEQTKKKNVETSRVKLVMSVPATCGNAVLRNRFRRMIRGYFLRRGYLNQLSPSQGLWIRLSANHRLSKKITLKEWSPLLDKISSNAELL